MNSRNEDWIKLRDWLDERLRLAEAARLNALATRRGGSKGFLEVDAMLYRAEADALKKVVAKMESMDGSGNRTDE